VQGLVWDPRVPISRFFPGEQVVTATEPSKDNKDLLKDNIEVPADCRVLIIANPGRAFPKEVQDAIDRYLERGGKVMVLTKTGLLPNGKFTEDGMTEFCKKLNVELTNDYIIKFATRSEDVINVTANVPPGTNNKVAREFTRNNFMLFLPRTVRPGKTPGQYQAEVILHVTEQANGEVWAETAPPISFMRSPAAFVRELKFGNKLADKIGSAEPLPVGVAVTDREGHPRGVIVGDDTFITTDFMRMAPGQTASYDFFRSCLEWLGERPVTLIGNIRAKERQFYSLPKDEVKGGRLLLLPIGLMALALAGTGAGIWIVRRR
jgi:hypothetical protein